MRYVFAVSVIISRAKTDNSQINAGIQAADGAIVSQEVRDTFENANTWLQEKRASAADNPTPQTNGTNGKRLQRTR